MRFEFATATRILFGAGTLREIGPIAKELGSRALVVTGRTTRRAEPLTSALEAHGIPCAAFSIPGEPTTEIVSLGTQHAREQSCDVVIGFGGGSALDAAKAIAALLTSSGDLLDYLEVIGKGKALTQRAAPCIAIPTTAGTGAEVTRNAVLASPAHRVKVSLRSPLLPPKVALVDPELTYDLPPAITASTGLDALTQLIEPYVSHRANPLTDPLCIDGLERVARSLRRAYEHARLTNAAGHEAGRPATGNLAAREDMSLASLFGGLALANAGLGAVHGFAAPLGGMFPAPHGAVCATLLPHVMAMNLRALRERAPADEALKRYDDVARVLTGNRQATADEAVGWVREACAALEIRGLRSFGVAERDLPLLVEKSRHASSMKANPIVLTPDELGEILKQAL